jgi:formate hydrogenlyase subunit 3/multisubunit Na+/H+ antiporter MnhD subunit
MEMSDNLIAADNKKDEKPDTYHDQDALIRIAVNADRIAWLFFVLFGVVGVLIVVFVWWYFSGKLNISQLIIYFLTALVPFFLGGFFWIASRVISEGLYLLMDVEDNTRRPQSPSKE